MLRWKNFIWKSIKLDQELLYSEIMTRHTCANPHFVVIHTARPVNGATEGSTQVACMCASCMLPRKVGQKV